MNRTTTIAVIALALLLVLVFALSGRPGGRKLGDEPQVNLTVNAETGERRRIGMEDYIKGVVGGEMGQLPAAGGEKGDWPEEAYAAQAILARSFALTFMGDDGVIDISTDVESAQAYAPENITPAIESAVEKTRGMVMLHRDDYVQAWFHSYSGGHTATAKEGLNYQEEEPGFIVAKAMPDNEVVPDDHRRWEVSIPLAEVARSLEEKGLFNGAIDDVAIAQKGPSGRATTINVSGGGQNASIPAPEFRLAVGAETMKSTLLDKMNVSGSNLVMTGKGFGHGVGLSQWDAYQLAKDGRNAEQIVQFFFQNVRVEKLWD